MREDKEIVSFFSGLYAPPQFPRPFLEGLDWCPISDSDREGLEGRSPIYSRWNQKCGFWF